MQTLSISDLKRATADARLQASVHVQVDSLTRRDARNGKPFWEMVGADAEARMTLRAWSDEPSYSVCEGLTSGMFVEVSGDFSQSANFGLEAKNWTCRPLSTEERDVLLAGSSELRARQAADFAFLEEQVAGIADPRLHAVSALFFAEHGERLRRTAAARQNHHARRGGLVEHMAQMTRAASALSAVYGTLNRDLLIAGVVFHDAGKLWENAMPADGFSMPFDERGELLGHITIGIELVNSLWRKASAAAAPNTWACLRPASEDVRLHLLHLLAAHHGELQFGSPVVPKTPEAWALHYIDNLDAKLEMVKLAYDGKSLGPRIFEKRWPLPGNTVASLERFHAPE